MHRLAAFQLASEMHLQCVVQRVVQQWQMSSDASQERVPLSPAHRVVEYNVILFVTYMMLKTARRIRARATHLCRRLGLLLGAPQQICIAVAGRAAGLRRTHWGGSLKLCCSTSGLCRVRRLRRGWQALGPSEDVGIIIATGFRILRGALSDRSHEWRLGGHLEVYGLLVVCRSKSRPH
jgi:hypothetical protein